MDSVAESSKNRKRLREEEEQQQKEEIEAEETSSTDQTLSLGKYFFPTLYLHDFLLRNQFWLTEFCDFLLWSGQSHV